MGQAELGTINKSEQNLSFKTSLGSSSLTCTIMQQDAYKFPHRNEQTVYHSKFIAWCLHTTILAFKSS